jgi:hypothetical protein
MKRRASPTSTCRGWSQEVELGSYGRRTFTKPDGETVSFVYGTGLAEPRFSIAFERIYR